jgi:Response regulators consisting of a CheY-like receiver domain and a winged-helix DNA-binding domain
VTRILVIEDNRNLATGLRNNLEIEGYEVAVAGDGTSGLALARSTMPDLVILDLMLPGMDGYRVLRTLRDDGIDTPVLILSARGEETDKVLGFHLGADDYGRSRSDYSSSWRALTRCCDARRPPGRSTSSRRP